MTNSILAPQATYGARADNLDLAVDRAREYADAAQAANTRRGYASDWRGFVAWCREHGLEPMPATPQTVVLYITNLANRAKLSTVRHHLAAIVNAHRDRGIENPAAHEVVKRVLRGITRTLGVVQRKKTAATLDHVRAMLLEIKGDDLKAKRDRALLLIGFAAALRRSELAALNVDDLTFCKEGLRLTVRRSKTDQDAAGVELAIPLVPLASMCAARAVKAWIDAAALTSGPVFRSFSLQRKMLDNAVDGRAVANLIQLLARKARLEGDFGGHSLRAGFVTSAARAKVSLDSIARTTRHKSIPVLTGYIRHATAFDDVALSHIIH